MSKVWVLRGCAAAVFAVILAAWAVGIAGSRDDSASDDKADVPTTTDSSTVADAEPSDVGETSTAEPTPGETPTDLPSTDPAESTDGAVVPVDAAPGTPDATRRPPASTPTKRPDKPTPKPSDPPSGTPSPSNPSSPGCSELLEVLDCVLAPVTTRP